MTVTLTLEEVRNLAVLALQVSNVSEANANSVAESVVAAEADGIHSHGLMRLPTYCEHARCGKIDGKVAPSAERASSSALTVDARDGFAHPAIDLGLPTFLPLAKENGIAAMAVSNSYNCGVVGYHVERMAEAGLIALGFVNAPASIAPWGGSKVVFGTNPIACAVPRQGHAPLLVDQSSSVASKSEVVAHSREGTPIPEGWALDRDGNSTTDPDAALDGGTMIPAGGYKGASIALIVEIMAAAVAGASLSINAFSFADNEGGSPRTGQLFIAIRLETFADSGFDEQITQLLHAIEEQDGTRLPGQQRLKAREQADEQGITLQKELYKKIADYTLANDSFGPPDLY